MECDLRKCGKSPTALPLSSSSRMCCGCQPVRRVAQPDSSRARKQAWSRKGLSGTPLVEGAMAFHVAAGIEPVVEWTVARRLSSGTLGKKSFEDDLVGLGQGGLGLRGGADGSAGPRLAQ